ncbi:MAG: methionyl-tRNA formyltransferase [Rickettsiales bacterium]|jgi:methionyl-tRNA formyltransferase|nr:methionyl-tRNA formyltransferase [Rickettsiales bacterium]
MQLVLMGTSEWAIPVFDRAAVEHEIMAVFTRAPKPAGRKMELQKSPVHIWAESRGIPVRHDVKNYDLKPDFNVVVSYGVILRDNVLGAAPTINLHPSLLPKYRGPSPMLTAILNGDASTGVCLMDAIDEVDAGYIHMMRPLKIDIDDTNADLEAKVSALSAGMLSEYLKNPNAYPAVAQVGTPTFTRKFTSADLDIDWNKSAIEIHNQIRSIGGRTKIGNEDIKILKTELADDGRLQILVIQPVGKKPMDFQSFLNGHQWLKTDGFNNVAI